MPIVVAVLGVIIVVMGAVFFLAPTPSETPTTEPAVTEQANRTEDMQVTEEIVVTDEPNPSPETGLTQETVTESANYFTPARTEHKVTVVLTLEGDVVVDSNVLYNDLETYSDPNQQLFDEAYKPLVVGKTLDQISLSRVGGASLTTGAFNDALAKIKANRS
jgi:hypothetical protein